MKPSKIERKLLAAAKANPPSAAVPYAFEQRIMAHICQMPVPDAWADWAGALWRAAAPCMAVAIFLGVWTAVVPRETAATDLSQDLEQTVLAAIAQDNESLQ